MWSMIKATGRRASRPAIASRPSGIDQKLDVPPKPDDPPRQCGHRLEADPNTEQLVEANAGHARLGEVVEFPIRYIRRHHRDPATTIGMAAYCFDEKPVVGAVNTDLDQDAALDPEA